MATRTDPAAFRTSVRLFVVGCWGVLLGLVVLYGLANSETALLDGVRSIRPLFDLEDAVRGALAILYRGGVATVAVGAGLMGLGGVLLHRAGP